MEKIKDLVLPISIIVVGLAMSFVVAALIGMMMQAIYVFWR